MAVEDGPLHATSRREDDGTLVVSLAGELDIATTDAITRYVEERISDGYRRIAIDLADVTFVDASGMATFVVIRTLLDGLDGALTLRNP